MEDITHHSLNPRQKVQRLRMLLHLSLHPLRKRKTRDAPIGLWENTQWPLEKLLMKKEGLSVLRGLQASHFPNNYSALHGTVPTTVQKPLFSEVFLVFFSSLGLESDPI